ncbi:MAG: ABC transporter ATP-binding protein [Planctomycetaceae bacterium]
MREFVRALKDASRNWPVLAAAFVCSAGVAALWGAHIAALFAIIEVTLNGESLQSWNDRRIQETKQRIADGEAERSKLEARVASELEAGREAVGPRNRLDTLSLKLAGDQASLYSAEKLRPWLAKLLPSDPFKTVLVVVAFVVVSTFIKHMLMLASAMLVGWVALSITRSIRLRIFDKALELDRQQFMRHGASGFLATITHTADMLSHGITAVYGGAITEPLKILACLAGAWFISWQLTIACLMLAPVVGFLMVWLNKQMRNLSRHALRRVAGYHHVLLEALSNVLTVQSYTMEPYEKQRFRDCTSEMRRLALWHTFYHTLANPITEILGIGMVATSIAIGAWLVINQETQIFGITMTDRPMTVPGIMVFFGMLIGASDPVRKLSGIITGFNQGCVAAHSLYPLLDTPSRLVQSSEPRRITSRHRRIRLDRVSFSYDGIDTVLKDVDLEIAFGERVAIVGPNGGGKSTLVNLICRFYDPNRGRVMLDDVPLTELAIDDLRRRIAIVTQQTELFNETIHYNIRYGRWDASDADIEAAARKAFAHDFISQFPEGYRTVVGPSGFRLSGGQRQRIALARAFLRDAEILVLDEATSQIDAESEKLIHEALSAHVQNRTVIMITHRASTLALADSIVRVEHGVVTKRSAAEDAEATERPQRESGRRQVA